MHIIQVKEMEAILKRRNPNSLPTLMIAAAAAPDNTANNNRSAYTEVLESRVKKLEKELEEKDGETDRLMRGVEQKYHSVKVCVVTIYYIFRFIQSVGYM